MGYDARGGIMTNAFLDARIVATEALIVKYEAAMDSAGDTGIASYTLDTGQNRQTVVKMNITELRKAIAALYNQLATLELRRFGRPTTVAPIW